MEGYPNILYKIFLISSLVIMIIITVHFVHKSDFESYFTDVAILILYLVFYILSSIAFLKADFNIIILLPFEVIISIMICYCIHYIIDDFSEIYEYYIEY